MSTVNSKKWPVQKDKLFYYFKSVVKMFLINYEYFLSVN